MTISGNIQMNNKNPSAEKKQIFYYYWLEFRTSQLLWLHSPIGDGSVERKQISSFIFGFNSQKLLHESSYDEYTLLKQKTGASTDFISNIKNVRIIIIIIIIITMIIIIVMMRMITKLVSTKN